jgi:pimeloyl-ACP methyl ester carboxylesterase
MHRHIPSSRRVVIDDAGHAANMDQPESFSISVRDFLEQLSPHRM